MLPGGIEMVRFHSRNLNSTLFEDETFNGAENIVIHDTPVIVVQYSRPEPSDYFNMTEECEIYSSKPEASSLVDGIQICVKPVGSALLVGELTPT